jgi:hypothetical protein
MFRCFLLVMIAFSSAACGLVARQEHQARVKATIEEAKSDTAFCKIHFTEDNRDAIARAKCFNDADAKFATVVSFPDLINLRIAKRAELAEQQSAGKMTRAQAMLEFAQTNTQIETEFQRRSNADRSVRA